MDKQEAFVMVAAILTTLLETGGSPESMLYIFCNMDMNKWQIIRSVLLDCKWVSISGHYVTLTAEGTLTAEALNKALQAKQAK